MASYREIFESGYEQASGCGEHALGFSPEEVAEVLWAIWDGYDAGSFEYSGSDDRTVSLCRLKDGRFGVLEESEDYTGHGCMCSGSADIFDNLEDALRLGISTEDRGQARSALGLPEEEVVG